MMRTRGNHADMTDPRFYQLDVFGARPGSGNPLGVVTGATGWSDAAMQAFARWTNLVETTFLLPPTHAEAGYRLRIFTPGREIPFAGHPTIGSAYVALTTGFAAARDHVVLQECGAGLLPIRVHAAGVGHGLSVRAPAAQVLPHPDHSTALLDAACAGLELAARRPSLVEGGRSWWIAESRNEAGLRAWQPDHKAILELALATGAIGVCAFARSDAATHQLAVRAFPAAVGIVEDPASGAANGLIGALIAQQDPGSPLASGYRVSQGREMGCDARIDIDFDTSGGVWVGGQSHLVVQGSLQWPVDT